MAGVLDSVNQRTQLVGQNRLELLMFRLQGDQVYGINVFKVREVLQCPPLTHIPNRHRVVRGVAHIRGGTIPVMDLGMAVGQDPIDDPQDSFVIITEYNSAVQGFLVSAVERIMNMQWEDIKAPPSGAGSQSYLTAVTQIDDKLIDIIDVEKVLTEISPMQDVVSDDVVDADLVNAIGSKKVLTVDDSAIARKQVKSCMDALGVSVISFNNGRQALDYLKGLADKGVDINDELLMVISDIEMPEMDGYTLTTEIRADSRLSDLYIILHTSLSGMFNEAMVEKVGANSFLSKFKPDELAATVQDRARALMDANVMPDVANTEIETSETGTSE